MKTKSKKRGKELARENYEGRIGNERREGRKKGRMNSQRKVRGREEEGGR